MALNRSARLRPITSNPGQGTGLYINPTLALDILALTYSFTDQAHVMGTQAGQTSVARIAVIEGEPPFDPSAFLPTTDLSSCEVMYDHFINDFGPGNLITPPGKNGGIRVEASRGATILVSATQCFTSAGAALAGTQVVSKVSAIGEPTASRSSQAHGAGAASSAAAATATGATGTGYSGGGGGGGTYSQGGHLLK